MYFKDIRMYKCMVKCIKFAKCYGKVDFESRISLFNIAVVAISNERIGNFFDNIMLKLLDANLDIHMP